MDRLPVVIPGARRALRDKLLKQTWNDKLRCEQLECNEIYCNGLQIVRGNQSLAELRDSNLRVTNITAGRVLQNGQQVLSLPQLLQALGWWKTNQPAQPGPNPNAPPPQPSASQ